MEISDWKIGNLYFPVQMKSAPFSVPSVCHPFAFTCHLADISITLQCWTMHAYILTLNLRVNERLELQHSRDEMGSESGKEGHSQERGRIHLLTEAHANRFCACIPTYGKGGGARATVIAGGNVEQEQVSCSW